MPTPTYASIPEPATNWTGFYVNAGYGYGLWAARENSVSPVTGHMHDLRRRKLKAAKAGSV